METEVTTVENNDCNFVDIGGIEQPLSDGNRSWKFSIFVSLQSAEVVFFSHKSFLFSFCYVYLFPNGLFTI